MSLLSERQIPADLGDQLRNAAYVTAEFLSDIVHATCRRLPSAKQNERVVRIERLIQSQAWTYAALALIELELPQWQIRRLAYEIPISLPLASSRFQMGFWPAWTCGCNDSRATS